VNHDLKALKMLFKSARRDSAITDDPTEFVEAVRKERGIKIKRPFTLPELRSVLDLANDEWRSMILFGLYTGQRLGDIATLRWNNLDLARGELRLSTRKTGKAIVLPLAASLRKQIECLLTSSNEPSAPVHPKAFDLVEGQRKTGNLSNQFAGQSRFFVITSRGALNFGCLTGASPVSLQTKGLFECPSEMRIVGAMRYLLCRWSSQLSGIGVLSVHRKSS
jgi:integrase